MLVRGAGSCHLPPMAATSPKPPPRLLNSALKLSFFPSLFCLSSPSSSPPLSPLPKFHTFTPKTFFTVTTTRHTSPNPLSKWAPHQTLLMAKASFSSDGGGSGGERELLVQHLLVKEDDTKLLVDLQQRIAAGEDLSDLAVEYSACPSKEQGGMLGWIRKGQMVQEFEETAFSAPLNKVVRCKTKFGWHLLQVLSEREASVLQEIPPTELHVKMQDSDFVKEVQLIDVREPDEVEKASLPGFQVLPLHQFGSWGPEITTKLDPAKDTYVMCHHGMRSLQVAKWLQSQGFRRVFNISGGIHAYAVNVDPSVPTY